MDEWTELAGRNSGESSLDETLDKNEKEHVFCLKRFGRVVAVVRLEKFDTPLKCFYLREIFVPKNERGRGYASTLVQEVTDVMKDRNIICVAYQIRGDEDEPDSLKVPKQVEKMFGDCGWRRVLTTPVFDDDAVWALNLPEDDNEKAHKLIAAIADTGNL